MDPNPYESPPLPAEPESPVAAPPEPARLAWLVLPTLAGVFIGEILLAPLTRALADPMVASICAGLGGLAGLAVGVALRVWVALRSNLT